MFRFRLILGLAPNMFIEDYLIFKSAIRQGHSSWFCRFKYPIFSFIRK